MSRQIKSIITLTNVLSVHLGVTHWALSRRLSTKGDFLDRLHNGGDLRTATAEHVLQALSDMWPPELDWPPEIDRPSKTPQKKAAS